MKKEIRYCSYCGAKMIIRNSPAETEKLYCYGGDCYKRRMGDAFNILTGKKQYAREFVCPKYKSKWIFESPHDFYYFDDIFTLK